ncbi:MAG: hypothetical protein FJY85_15370, partial [Deltaproteobacteria bacterium]|nr:hypothetical protein [Deltaproteobacteria bacterium]
MDTAIPQLKFRIDPGYTFDAPLDGPSFERDNLLVGALPKAGAPRGLFLGKPAEFEHGLTSKLVWLDTEGAHAVYVMGKRRSGKTFTLGILTEGLVSGGWVRRGTAQAVLLLDTMNVFATSYQTVFDTYADSSKSVSELKHWGIPKESLNLRFFYPRGTPKPAEVDAIEVSIRPADLDADDWAALFGVDTYSDPIGQLIATIYDKVAVEGYQQASGTGVAANPAYDVRDLVTCLDTCPDMARFESRTQEAVRRRL